MSDRVLEEIAALKDEDWALREEAATLLGEFADPRGVTPLVDVLQDEDRAVRDAATAALRKIGQAAVPTLISVLRHPNGNVQEAAVSILKDLADPRALDPLIECLTSLNWVVRMHAARGLGVLGEERAVPSLVPLLVDRVKAVRVEATDALARIGRLALATLVAALRHHEWILRLHACEALGKIGVPMVVLFVPIAWLYLCRFGSPVPVSEIHFRSNPDIIQDELRKLGKLSAAEKRVLAIWVSMAFLWITRSPLTLGSINVPGWSQLLGQYSSYVHDATVSMAMALLLFLMPVPQETLNNGKNQGKIYLMDWETVRHGVPSSPRISTRAVSDCTW